MNKSMKKFIACLLLGALIGMMPPLLPAQQDQNPQKSDSEIKPLKERVSELEKQLQIVENVEKLDLQAKLAEANAKLANTEFGKFERELRDSNNKWLREWSDWFLVVVGFFVIVSGVVSSIFWFWLKSTANQLIADTVEKNLNGFKEAVDAQDVIKNQLKELKKERAASVLEKFITLFLNEEHNHPEQIKALSEEDLLQVFEDERYALELKYQAAKVLAVRKSPRLVPPLLAFLNSVIDSELDIDRSTGDHLRSYINFFTYILTPDTYPGITKFLNRLLTENPKHKDLFLTETVSLLVWVSFQLDIGDSVPILRRAIPHLKNLQTQQIPLGNLARYFDIFNEPEGIKEILNQHVTSGMSDAEDRCLELLQKHDPEFVNEWRARETTDNSNT